MFVDLQKKTFGIFDLQKINTILNTDYPDEWLLRFNIYKRVYHLKESWVSNLRRFLIGFKKGSDLNNAIQRGMNLLN